MYSRSYNTSNRVPLNYNGTSIKVDESVKEEAAVIPLIEENELSEEFIETINTDEISDGTVKSDEYLYASRPYARVPLMKKPVHPPSKMTPIQKRTAIDPGKVESKRPDKPNLDKLTDKKPSLLKTIGADDILLIGLLIILLGCEDVDLKLILAIAVLLFAGL